MTTKKLGLTMAILLAGSLAAAKQNKKTVTEFESAVITFEKGGTTISSEEQMKLKEAVEIAKVKGKIAKVEIAVWSDKEHPAKGDLSKADRKIAEERIDSVKKAIKQDVEHVGNIKAYNMAENSHWLGKHIHSDEAQLDTLFTKKGTTAALKRKDFDLIKEEGAPSKAVIILKVLEK